MAIIGIKYNEGGNPLNYEHAEITSSTTNESKIFDSGNFVKDWFNAKKHYFTKIKNEPLTLSSSVDHFFMDGAEYNGAYLHFENNEPILKYVDRTNEKWYLSPIVQGIEMYVESGTQPTWKELKEYCE